MTVNTGMVLIIDDEAAICEAIGELLNLYSVAVEAAQDGATAVDIMRTHGSAIRLALLDLTMPGMTTPAIVAALHDIDPDLPIVISTGHGIKVARERTTQLNITGYLQKPYDIEQLLALVRQYC